MTITCQVETNVKETVGNIGCAFEKHVFEKQLNLPLEDANPSESNQCGEEEDKKHRTRNTQHTHVKKRTRKTHFVML